MVCVVAGAAAIAPVAANPLALAAYSSAVLGEGVSLGAAVVAVGEGACVGVGALGGGSSAGIALATLVGPIGWAVVGCNKNDDYSGDSGYTWDCWKPVIRDTSTQPSCGMSLHCLAGHPNVRSMLLDQDGLLVGNVFDERFHLSPVSVKGVLAFHASIVSS